MRLILYVSVFVLYVYVCVCTPPAFSYFERILSFLSSNFLQTKNTEVIHLNEFSTFKVIPIEDFDSEISLKPTVLALR